MNHFSKEDQGLYAKKVNAELQVSLNVQIFIIEARKFGNKSGCDSRKSEELYCFAGFDHDLQF